MIRRSPLVGALIVAEVVIAGTIVSIAGGMFTRGIGPAAPAQGSAQRSISVTTGSSPHVIVDDARSKITVDVWDEPRVVIEDHAVAAGLVIGRLVPLAAERTAGGVRITRPGQGPIFSLGAIAYFGGVTVHVPRASSVELRGTGADVRGVRGGVVMRGDDGSVKLDGVRGNVDVRTQDGSIVLNGVEAASIAARTADGHLTANDVSAAAIAFTSDDGRITASGVTVSGDTPRATITSTDGSIEFAGAPASNGRYRFSTQDGRISLALPSNADLTVRAATDGGSIEARDGIIFDQARGGRDRVATLGGGRGGVDAVTADGSITLKHYGAQSSDG